MSLNIIRDAFKLAAEVTELLSQRDIAVTQLRECADAAARAKREWETMVDGLNAELEALRGVVPAGEYFVHAHAPLSVWQEADGADAQVVAVVTSEAWAWRIAAALNGAALLDEPPAEDTGQDGELTGEPPAAGDPGFPPIDPDAMPVGTVVTMGDLAPAPAPGQLVAAAAMDSWGCPNSPRCHHHDAIHVFSPGNPMLTCSVDGCGCGTTAAVLSPIAPVTAPIPAEVPADV